MWPADRFAVADGMIERVGDPAFGPLDPEVRDQAGTHRLGAVGLAAGGAVAAWAEFVLLRRRVGSLARGLGLGRALRRLLPAAAAAAMLLVALDAALIDQHPLVAAPIVVGPAAVAYLLLARWRGSETARALLQRVRA